MGALLVLGAAGIIYFASIAGAPPGDVPLTRTYSASRPAKLTSAPKASEPAGDECVGTNACTGPEDGPRAAPAPAPAPRAERQPKQLEVRAGSAGAREASAAQPPKAKPALGAEVKLPPMAEPASAPDLPHEEPAPAQPQPPPIAETPPQTVRAPESSMVVGRFQNKAGASYELERVSCVLDGARVYSGPSSGLVELFRRGLPAGVHQVSIVAEYRGRSAGVFSYTNGFKFTLQGSRRFHVPVGQPAQILVTAYERGGPTEPLAERLALSISTR